MLVAVLIFWDVVEGIAARQVKRAKVWARERFIICMQCLRGRADVLEVLSVVKAEVFGQTKEAVLIVLVVCYVCHYKAGND